MASKALYTFLSIAVLASFFSEGLRFASADSTSYGRLALQNVGVAFAESLSYLDILNSSSEPGSVKPFRKSLLAARNDLDIFAYSYPDSSSKDDIFTYLRGDLNSGYTLIGNFQDLQDVNYTKKVYTERLDACLSWKKSFEANIGKYDYKAYVLSASTTKLYDRKKDKLSKDYWRDVPAVPSLKISGFQNIAVLADGQLVLAVNYYDATVKLTDIWKTEYHTEFHDYRKLLRAIEYVGTEFPQVYSTSVAKAMNIIDNAYDLFGNLNDLCTEWEYYDQSGNKPAMQKVQAEIVTSWTSLKQWLTQQSFRSLLASLPQHLIPHKEKV